MLQREPVPALLPPHPLLQVLSSLPVPKIQDPPSFPRLHVSPARPQSPSAGGGGYKARSVSADLLQGRSGSHEPSSLARRLPRRPRHPLATNPAGRLNVHEPCRPAARRTGFAPDPGSSTQAMPQVQAAKQATVIVSEHGTVSYVGLFAGDGRTLVVVGRPPMKEAHVAPGVACRQLTWGRRFCSR
eukprot:763061-Hanusia_phi.AAC.8